MTEKLVDSYICELCGDLESVYSIPAEYFNNPNIKRGLRNVDGTGVVAGVTKIGSVQGYVVMDGERLPQPGKLYYRGIDVEQIVSAHEADDSFGYEEVAYLLLMGRLPTASQFEQFNSVIKGARDLPDGFFEDMILKAPSKNIMNKLSRSVLALYSFDRDPDDTTVENVMRQSIELIARFPGIVANAYAVKRHRYDGKSLYIHNPKEALSVSENFLRMLRKDKSYTDDEAKLLDRMLILHAEHGGGNNSAFVCRALSSSGTDTFSAVAGAVGALKGPLHGGANKKVMELFYDMRSRVKDPGNDAEVREYLCKVMDGEAGDRSGMIYGLGHAVYTESDPRSELVHKYARDIAASHGATESLAFLESIERVGIPLIAERKHIDIPICSNVDLYSGLVYSLLGIPEELYTPLFAIARIAGWCAHRLEELLTGGKLMRPAYRSATTHAPYVQLSNRV